MVVGKQLFRSCITATFCCRCHHSSCSDPSWSLSHLVFAANQNSKPNYFWSKCISSWLSVGQKDMCLCVFKITIWRLLPVWAKLSQSNNTTQQAYNTFMYCTYSMLNLFSDVTIQLLKFCGSSQTFLFLKLLLLISLNLCNFYIFSNPQTGLDSTVKFKFFFFCPLKIARRMKSKLPIAIKASLKGCKE